MTSAEAMAHDYFDEVEAAIVRSPRFAAPKWPPRSIQQAIDMLRERHPRADIRTIQGAAELIGEWLELPVKEQAHV